MNVFLKLTTAGGIIDGGRSIIVSSDAISTFEQILDEEGGFVGTLIRLIKGDSVSVTDSFEDIYTALGAIEVDGFAEDLKKLKYMYSKHKQENTPKTSKGGSEDEGVN